eukprot:m.189553 g.189553  ORF g.189553 m.189553 type:complete len:1001 (+) comp39413_c0_seq8:194-3196(+)
MSHCYTQATKSPVSFSCHRYRQSSRMTTSSLSTLSQLKNALESPTFVDFLNIYLNLPVFACKMYYQTKTNEFIFDSPSEKRCCSQIAVLSWILNYRIPFFLQTDFYKEALLSKQLTNNTELLHLFEESCSRKGMCTANFHSFFLQEIGTVTGFKMFRRFLHNTPGESVMQLFLEIERIRLSSDRFRKEDLLKSLQGALGVSTYFPERIFFMLQAAFLKIKMSIWNESREEINSTLEVAHAEAVNYLCFYWMKRYIIHRAVTMKKKNKAAKAICENVLSLEENLEIPKEEFFERPPCACCQLCYWVNKSEENVPELENKKSSVILPSLSRRIEVKSSVVELQSQASLNESLLVMAIVADELAGSPFLLYLQRRGKIRASNSLMFLQSMEKLLAEPGHLREFSDVLETIKACYLEPGCPMDFGLSIQLRLEILHHFSLGTLHRSVFQARHVALKTIKPRWNRFLQYDQESLQLNTANSRKSTPSSDISPVPSRTMSSTPASPLTPRGKLEIGNLPEQMIKFARLAQKALEIIQGNKNTCFRHSVSTSTSQCSFSSLNYWNPSGAPISTEELKDMAWKSFHATIVRNRIPKSVEKLPPVSEGPLSPSQLERPKKFLDVLLKEKYRPSFTSFLKSHNDFTPFLFWDAVHDMKMLCHTQKQQEEFAHRIEKTYFHTRTKGLSRRIKKEIKAVCKKEKDFFPTDLFSAASVVAKYIEDNWFRQYNSTLSPRRNGDDGAAAEATVIKKTIQNIQDKNRTRGLWAMFGHNVMSFRKGLASPTTGKEFRKYLLSVGEGPKKYDIILRRVIKGKAVNTGRLTTDLDFWIEVDKYKRIADEAGMPWGQHTPEDEFLIQRKAYAIIQRYLDSEIPPKVQINISNDIVQTILDNTVSGQIGRGLFHEAGLQTFTVLAFFWKKFCVYQFAERTGTSERARRRSFQAKKSKASFLVQKAAAAAAAAAVKGPSPTQQLLNPNEQNTLNDEPDSGAPSFSFSLATGLIKAETESRQL